MATVTITIKGIAIVYSTAPNWKVLFPFNADHRVVLSGCGIHRTELGFGQQVVSIGSTGSPSSDLPPGQPHDGFGTFINVTDPAHCHTEIRTLNGWKNNGVLLTVANGSFKKLANTKSHYLLIDDNNNETRPSAFIGLSGQLTLSGDAISLDARGHVNFSQSFNTNCTLGFDNECPGLIGDDDADFKMIYDVIEDALVPGRKFKLERELGDKPLTIEGGEKVFDTDPKPGYEGLPCNILVASNPNGLP